MADTHTDEALQLVSSGSLSGILRQPTLERVKALVQGALVERIQVSRPVAMFKVGGSALDYVAEHQDARPMKELLEYFWQLQKEGIYQIILTVGGGPIGDAYRKILRPADSNRAVQYNTEVLEDLASENAEGAAMTVTPRQMLSRYADLERLFNQGRIIIMSEAPRHLGIGRLDGQTVLQSDSDAQTLLLAELFGVKYIGLIKRTDGIYSFDPITGFVANSGSQEKWLATQSHNTLFGRVTYAELLKGLTAAGHEISRTGAHDGNPDHLITDAALQLFPGIYGLERI